jgi:hypothetical protein
MSLAGNTKPLAIVAAVPVRRTADDTEAFFNAMPVAELASLWCSLQRLSRRDQVDGAWTAKLYFDHLPYKLPERAFALMLEVLRSEADKATVMQLNDKLMPALMYWHGRDVIGSIETAAKNNPKLRWLIGGIHLGPDEPLKHRIAAIADIDGWRADEEAHRTPGDRLDCEAMSVPELARTWIEQYSKSQRDRDDNFFAVMDCERELREEDPDKAIDLILEILRLETNPVLLSLLAAGPLEEVISIRTIDRIEREALINKRFHDLLGGVWYYRAQDELRARLNALLGENRR